MSPDDRVISVVLGVHAFSTLAMMGLVWFVQVVHYPLMSRVGSESFAAFEAAHLKRTRVVVGPLMVGEALAAVVLLAARPEQVPLWMTIAGAVLLGGVWLLTFLVLVPKHERLVLGWDARTHARLVQWNLPRALMWTVRGVLAVLMLGV